MESVGLKGLFGGCYYRRKVLVTGHTGFKGSWLSLWLSELEADVAGLALAPDTTPAHWPLLRLSGVRDLRVDLRDGLAVREAVDQFQPEIVFHLAAQPLVQRSYRDPETTFDTNVLGLVHLLQSIRDVPSVRALINVTTDKVYMERPTEGGYRESDPLGGHDPYSSSKACAELVSECYRKSFDLRIATARAGNVIGGGDWAEDRLVPDAIRAVTSGSTLRIRNPLALRPWQHVLEPLSGYLRLGQKMLEDPTFADAWNFGPSPGLTLPVQALASLIQNRWPGLRVESDTGAHPHEAMSLQLDSTKATQRLHWTAVWDAETAIGHTVDWYRAYYADGHIDSRDDLRKYISAAQAQGQAWAA